MQQKFLSFLLSALLWAMMTAGAKTALAADNQSITWTWAATANQDKSFTIRATFDKQFTINWGDGSAAETKTGDGDTNIVPSHTYTTAGSYTVTITALSADCDFTCLSSAFQNLITLDVSGAPALRILDCGLNQLTTLDLSQNSALTELFCYNNQLTALDISQSSALITLYCNNNQLTALDLSKNSALTVLQCNRNQLTALDLSKNSALADLDCGYNQLTALDLSKNSALTELYCEINQLTALDVSTNTALTYLECYNNQLTALDVSTNTALINLYCNNNQLTALDVRQNSALTELGCSNNQLTALDVRQNSALTYLYCDNNQLTALDVSTSTALINLYCNNNQLTALDVSTSTALINLYCNNNQLTALDVSTSTALSTLWCGNNQLTALDVSTNTALTYLDCYNNQLTALDVSTNTALINLDCYNNQLTALDVSQNSALITLYCDNNQLTALDVSTSTALSTLWCGNNQLTFSTLPLPQYASYIYAPQNTINGGIVSGFVDLSSEYNINGNVTLYTWYEVTGTAELSISPDRYTDHGDGTFTFGSEFNDKTLRCKMTNATFPDFTASDPLVYEVTIGTHVQYTITATAGSNGTITPNGAILVAEGDHQRFIFTANNGYEVYQLLIDDVNIPDSIAGGSYTFVDVTEDHTIEVTFKKKAVEEDQILFTWNADANSEKSFTLRATDGEEFVVDWGDGTTNTYTGNGYINVTITHSYNSTASYFVSVSASTTDGHFTYLNCDNNQLTALDVSGATALTNLYCNNNQLTALDVSGAPALTELSCYNNQLTALDLSQNSALTELSCFNNQLTALDISQNSALTYLDCNNNQLTTLDISQNSALTELYCEINQLTALDLSTNTALTYLDCYNNQLTALDVSTNTALINLDCYNNQLTALDVSQNSALITLYCDNNQLTALDVSTSTALSTLWCGNNQLTFSTLPLPQYASYIYAPQNTINGGIVSGFVDLSSEYNINGNVTLYTWYEVTGTAELSISPDRYTDHGDGTFTFGSEFNDKTLRCKMTNATFPDFTASDPLVYEVTIGTHVQYTITATAGSNGTITPNGAILVAEGDHQRFIFTANNGYEVYQLLIDDVNIPDSIAGGSYTFVDVTEDHTIEVTFKKKAVEEDQILFTWNADANSEKSFTLRATDGEEFVVDWGDGTTNTYTGNGYINVTITHSYNSTASYFVSVSASTTDGHFTYLNCDNNQLTALDVSGATALTNLYCNNNQLTALDVSGAPALTELSCYNNQLTALDLSQNSALTELSCFNNQLTALDISQNSALTYLDCNNNQLTTLDISQNSALTELYCEINQLTALDLSTNTALSSLWCYNNQLTALDLSQNSALANLDCANNQLTALDLSTNTALSSLWCYNNQLTALDLSQNSALTFFLCNDNQLTALDLSTNTELIELYCFNNQLTALDVSTSTALSTLWCGNNQLTFSTLPLPQYASYIYAPQNTINGGIVSGFVDLSSEYNINGNVTLYTWYEVTGTAELSISPDRYTDHGDGTFTFGSEFNDKTLRCKMTNATFPDFTASDPLVYEVTIGTHVQYTITATAGSNGTIIPTGAILVAEGNSQRFTFTANNGYEVDELLVDNVNISDSIANGSYTFENVTEDHTIEVTFKSISVTQYTITATAGENGSIDPEGEITLTEGDNQTFTFIANNGYEVYQLLIDEVNVPDSMAGGSYTFVGVTEDHTIEVTFKPIPPTTYTISASAGENGSIDPEGEITVTEGDNQTFTFTANNGYEVDELLVDNINISDSIAGGSYTFENVTEDHTIEVTFKSISPATYIITATAGENGSIDPEGEITVTEGDNQTFTFTANNGYEVYQLLIDEVNVPDSIAGGSYTFENITEDHSIEVTFKAISVTQYTITATAGSNGTITPNGAILVDEGNSQRFTFTSNNGYEVYQLLIDGVHVPDSIANGSYTFENVIDNHIIAVTFKAVPFSNVELSGCPENGLLANGATCQLQAVVFPDNALNKTVVWRSTNPNTAIVDATGKVTARSTGVTYIIAKVQEGDAADTCHIRVVQPVSGIVLTPAQATLLLGEEKQLMAKILPENATIMDIIWSSSDETAVTVDAHGKITGIAAGEGVITAKTVDGDFEATCTVVVVQAYTQATGVTVTPKTLAIERGETYQLSAEVKPANASQMVTWSSNNPAVAIVEADGTVTALAAGKATITAKTDNNYSATCAVTVTIPIDSIVVTPDEWTLPLKGAKALKATVYPSDASNKTIKWSSANTALATVSATGVVTAKNTNGVVEIYATNTASGISGICVITVGTGISAAPPMDISEENTTNHIVLYPNPTVEKLKIESGKLRMNAIKVFDITGRVVLEMNHVDNNEAILDLSNYADGVYFINVDGKTTKIVKK